MNSITKVIDTVNDLRPGDLIVWHGQHDCQFWLIVSLRRLKVSMLIELGIVSFGSKYCFLGPHHITYDDSTSFHFSYMEIYRVVNNAL